MARCGVPMARGGGQDLPARERSPRRKPPDTAHERKDLPAQEHAPRRRPPDTAHGRKDLPRAGTLPTAKASRHGARAKGFAPRRNAPHGESLPTRRTGERVCPARERSPRRRPPDTAHGRKDLPARERSPRRRPPDTAHERKDLPAQKRSPRRRHPDTAHERKDLPRAGTLSSAKASRHGTKAKGFVRGVRVRPTCRRTAGRPRSTDSQKNTPSAGSHPRGRGRCRVHSPKKIRLLHETQLFYGESHVGSR